MQFLEDKCRKNISNRKKKLYCGLSFRAIPIPISALYSRPFDYSRESQEIKDTAYNQ